MKQQWTFYGRHDSRTSSIAEGEAVNAVEHEAIAIDRVTGFYRNPIDHPFNLYERELYADAFCTVLKSKVDRLTAQEQWDGTGQGFSDPWEDTRE